MKRLVIVLLLIICSASAQAQEATIQPYVSLQVSPHQAFVGDIIKVQIIVRAPFARQIEARDFEGNLGPFAIRAEKRLPGKDIFGVQVLVHNLELTSFKTGDQILPAIRYEAIYEDGSSASINSPAALVTIRSVSENPDGPEQAAGFTDILRPEEEETIAGWPWWYWVLAIAGLIVLVGIIWWFFKMRTPSSVRQMLKKSPAEQALQDLYALEKEELLRAGKFDTFYTSLSRIIRRYLGLRYHILSLEMTSKELKTDLFIRWKNDSVDRTAFTELLQNSDLVKFARHLPSITDGAESLETSRQIIYATRDDLTSDKRKEVN